MPPSDNETSRVKIEDMMALDGVKPSKKEIQAVADDYYELITWKSYRSGFSRMFRGYDFDSYLALSRELFWNSLSTKSNDLKGLELEFSIPFARKEAMDFLAKLVTLGVKPKIQGDSLDALGMKILNGIYKRWHFKNNEKVETFWELLYGIMNGTVCSYIGYLNTDVQRRYLDSYDPETGEYKISTKDEKYWSDVIKCVVPIEDIYLPKIYERNIQKQGRLIWRTQMDAKDFYAEFGHYKMAKYVFPGNRIAEDSLYFRLLGGTGTTTSNKIDVLRKYDWIKDEYRITAGGILLNGLGSGEEMEFAPMPFKHKMAPFTWGIMNPLDEKFAYGLSVPFMVKDPHKILNTSFNMLVERELRSIDPPIITSDLEAPEFIFGQHKVIGVNDINAYKEFTLAEPSQGFFTMVNSLQQNMSASANGGANIAAASRQPKSARGEANNQQQVQEAQSNAITMYYDILRQRVLLVIKTALQFYGLEKYSQSDEGAYRTITVANVPLSLGGIGDMQINITDKKRTDIELFLEGIRQSAKNGKKVEVVDVPLEFLQNVECEVTDIVLEPENQSELDKQSYVANVIVPMQNMYIPMKLADPGKVMMRHLEKMGESISDFATEDVMQAIASDKPVQMQQPQQGGGPTGQGNTSMPQGSAIQSGVGMKFGMNQSGSMQGR
jgi:hypothetical protein